MKAERGLRGVALLGALALAILGCTAEARRDGGEQAKDTAKDAAKEAEKLAEKAGQKIEKAAEEMAPKVEAAKQTADVKMALMADSTVDASNINVDTDGKTKTVHLMGTVPTAAQKTTAERIAKDKAAGYTVHNMLTVAPKGAATPRP